MAITTIWVTPPNNLSNRLIPGTVHVWRTFLDDSHERASRFRAYLSDDEHIKADRCRAPQPQYQFVITRGILRILLSRYSGVPPTELNFASQSQGKPMLATPHSLNIQFNVSHTRGMALIVFALEDAVGIDVEKIDRNVQDHDIAERYFSARESAYLTSLPTSERKYQFFSHWTCKEAYLKMLGKGITGGLAQCELSIDPDQPAVRLSHLDQQVQKEKFSLYRMSVGAEHIGAVASACSVDQISYWNWQDEYLA